MSLCVSHRFQAVCDVSYAFNSVCNTLQTISRFVVRAVHKAILESEMTEERGPRHLRRCLLLHRC